MKSKRYDKRLFVECLEKVYKDYPTEALLVLRDSLNLIIMFREGIRPREQTLENMKGKITYVETITQ